MFSTASLRSARLLPLARRSLLQQQQQQQQCRLASTLILSDPLTPAGEAPAATQSAVTAAAQLGADSIDLLVVGDTAPSKVPTGISSVYYASTAQPVAETVASTLQSIVAAKGDEYAFVVGTSSKYGATVIPRAAALLGASPVTDIVQVLESGMYDNYCPVD